MRFQTTNTSVMEWFWMISMLIFEELWNGGVVRRELLTKVAKRSNFGQIPEVVPPIRSQSVLVPIQAVPVPLNRMQSVPVPIREVLVPQCSKCLELCIFV